MFTLFVLWLLVACIPALVILATLGLGRLERALAHDSVTATDVAEFLEGAGAGLGGCLAIAYEITDACL